MQTTANRVGLEHFLDTTWPIIRDELSEPPEFWVIGSLSGAPQSLLDKLDEVGAICTGYVKDLASVLRPYDIHIVPWEHDTGVRTRVPLILNYKQALVAVKDSVACFPELHDKDNCLLASDLNDMANEIIDLLSKHEQRRQIAERGRETFLAHFTREAVQPRFDSLLKTFS
jgi:glycosyltransferase involved in cell wall biosynthesis